MNRAELMNVVEQYCHADGPETGEVKIVRIPDQKTIFIEQHGGEGGRSILLSEHKVDGKTVWAGYSSYSGIVYISQSA